mmetsp:Transcript_30382/g.85011  ORF Transcript_30382/g.85011 Transcript_30382/m.85011 type:complete len:243 (+) Transcript_30382:1172-1900(+)
MLRVSCTTWSKVRRCRRMILEASLRSLCMVWTCAATRSPVSRTARSCASRSASSIRSWAALPPAARACVSRHWASSCSSSATRTFSSASRSSAFTARVDIRFRFSSTLCSSRSSWRVLAASFSRRRLISSSFLRRASSSCFLRFNSPASSAPCRANASFRRADSLGLPAALSVSGPRAGTTTAGRPTPAALKMWSSAAPRSSSSSSSSGGDITIPAHVVDIRAQTITTAPGGGVSSAHACAA